MLELEREKDPVDLLKQIQKYMGVQEWMWKNLASDKQVKKTTLTEIRDCVKFAADLP